MKVENLTLANLATAFASLYEMSSHYSLSTEAEREQTNAFSDFLANTPAQLAEKSFVKEELELPLTDGASIYSKRGVAGEVAITVITEKGQLGAYYVFPPEMEENGSVQKAIDVRVVNWGERFRNREGLSI